MGSSVFGCSPSSVVLLGVSNFLWLELFWRSKMGLWCCINGVSYALRLQYCDGHEGLGIRATSLSVGLRFSLQPSFRSWPDSPLMIGLVGLIKAKTPSTSINQPKQTHTTCNVILIGTDLRVGSKSLCCRLSLLFHCFL